MPNIKQITLPSGTTYDLVDQGARDLIADIQSYTSYLGVTSTSITDGSTTNPITVNGKSVTAKTGDIVNYGSKEFIWNGSAWQEFGDMSGLGALAYKDSASGNYKPEGTVSQPTFTGKSMTSTGKFTPSGEVTVLNTGMNSQQYKVDAYDNTGTKYSTYIPSGNVSAPIITVTPSTTTMNGITDVGTLPTFTATVENEVLTLGFNQGTLPSKGSNTDVVIGIESATASTPSFSGNEVTFKTDYINKPTAWTATFTGIEDDISVTGTTDGAVSAPTFTGTSKTVTVS